MKIYRVTVANIVCTTQSHTLFTSYQSAAQSYAYWCRKTSPITEVVTFTTVHVPDDAWKPVDKVAESKLGQVQQLWEQLVTADPDGLDALLDELVKRVQPPAPPKPKPAAPLRDQEKREAEALFKLDRLVDAQ